MTMTFNLNKFWHGVRQYECKFVKTSHDNTSKDNVAVTSSILSQNDGTIRILTNFWPKTIVNFQKQTKIRYCSVVSIILHLTCAFQVIKLENEGVIALFHQFSYNFYILLKTVKHHNFKTPCPVHFTNIDNF